MKVTHNKLVRDLIPLIIRRSSGTPLTRVLNDKQFRAAVRKKLLEECAELIQAKKKEHIVHEIADVLEVLITLTGIEDVSWTQVERTRKRKRRHEVDFERKFFSKALRNKHMRFPDERVSILWGDTYLALITNSVGTKMFRSVFARVNGKRQDVLRGGDLSCAVYVSTILSFVQLLDQPHTTVKRTEKDMMRYDWKRVKSPRLGAVLIWEKKTGKSGEAHRHIGFYIGRGKAISNSPDRGYPVVHHWTFGSKRGEPTRAIESIYWNKRLD